MTTVNHSYSIPPIEHQRLQGFVKRCKKFIQEPNTTEIVRVAIHNLITEKEPKDISPVLNFLGRKQRGRPKKSEAETEAKKSDVVEVDFSRISDSQWKKIELLFSSDDEARIILSEILFDLQNAWKRGVSRKQATTKVKKWRRLQKWQESGIWNEVYRRLLPTLDKNQINAWNEIFLKSFLMKRNRNE